MFTFEESLGLAVSADFHLFYFYILPLVHGDGSDEAQVDAEPSMLSRTFQADPHAVGDADPLRVEPAALEATSVSILRPQVFQRFPCPWASHNIY